MKNIYVYLIFNGNCRQAMEFYKKCLGGELHQMTFAEMPGNPPPEVQKAKDRIMHARLTAGSAVLMASDTMPGMPHQQGDNYSVSLDCESVPEIEKLFAALSEKGTVKMPLQETFWAQRFGMFNDQFGIPWMLNLDRPTH